MTITAVLVDLDETFTREIERTHEVLRAVAERARERGIDPAALASAVADAAASLLREAPVYVECERLGIWWGEALWGGFTGDTAASRAIRDFVPGYRSAVWSRALATLGASDLGLARGLADALPTARRERELVDPDAAAVLADLARDHSIALVTNGASDVQRSKLERSGLAKYFHVVVVSGDIDIGKPDPRIFAHALTALGTSAAEAVMVGDSLARDIVGARAAGLRSVWIDRTAGKEDDVDVPDDRRPRVEPDARITRLRELPAALDGLERRRASPRASV